MSSPARFFRQPSKAYRDFQIAFMALTLNFFLPSMIYLFAPEVAQQQFVDLNAMLGGDPYTFPEHLSHFWRYLGTANVLTLALCCGLLQLNLRRWFAVLLPLTFMKACAATLWLVGYLQHPEFPAFAAAAALDFVTSAAFVFFASRAARDIAKRPDEELVPRPWDPGRERS